MKNKDIDDLYKLISSLKARIDEIEICQRNVENIVAEKFIVNDGIKKLKYFSEKISEYNIIDIIGEYIDLEKKGDNYIGCCPFHRETTPSFVISQKEKCYYCFGCGSGGNVIDFIMKKEGINIIEALKVLDKKVKKINMIKNFDFGNFLNKSNLPSSTKAILSHCVFLEIVYPAVLFGINHKYSELLNDYQRNIIDNSFSEFFDCNMKAKFFFVS